MLARSAATAWLALASTLGLADVPTIQCGSSGLQGLSPQTPASSDATTLIAAYRPVCGNLGVCVRPATHMAARASVDENDVRLDFYVGLAPIGLPGVLPVAPPVPSGLARIEVATLAPLPAGSYHVSAQVHAVDDATGNVESSCPLATFGFRVVDRPQAIAERVTVVEYHHAAMDHYFVTADPLEVAALDSGVFEGWQRTGFGWTAWAPDRSNGQGVATCRYYLLPGEGMSSHFFSTSQDECAFVAERFASSWTLESPNAFDSMLPGLVDGLCQEGSTRVWRYWNGRLDSNHRYVTAYDQQVAMAAKGWVLESSPMNGMCTTP